MKHSRGLKKKVVKIRGSVLIGSLNEPNVPECKPSQVWKIRLIKIEMTGRYKIEIKFWTRPGKIGSLRVDAGSRSDFDRIRRELDSRNARLPFDKKAALAFTESLIRQVPATPFIACASPVFVTTVRGSSCQTSDMAAREEDSFGTWRTRRPSSARSKATSPLTPKASLYLR